MGNRAEFLDLFAEYPIYNGYSQNATFEEIYYWMGEPWKVYDMMAICKNNRPAIEALARRIETKFGGRTDLNVREDFVKQMIGTAFKHILGYFGYVPTIQKTFLKGSAQWFKSGMHYTFDENATRTKIVHWEPKIIPA
jgi:hypothetical protein